MSYFFFSLLLICVAIFNHQLLAEVVSDTDDVATDATTPQLLTGKEAFEHFQNYNKRTGEWMKGIGDPLLTLQDAMDSVALIVPWLMDQPELPPGLDPLVSKPPYIQYYI